MEYNNEFEEIDSEQKAYVLGMFYADGCITNSNAVRLSLVDKQIIEEIFIEFPFFNLGSFDFSKYNPKSKVQYSISKKDKTLQEHLIKYGVRFNKSTTNAEDLHLPKLEYNLMSHFIRGYFDGNGSIYTLANRPNLRRMEICSSSKTFITELKDYFKSIGVECRYREKDNTASILYILEWIKRDEIMFFKKFLYREASISLLRKKKIFDYFEIVNKTDSNPKCSLCNGNLQRRGTRMTKKGLTIRFNCKPCNKGYTFPVPIKSDELLESPKAYPTIDWSKVIMDNDVTMDNQQPS